MHVHATYTRPFTFHCPTKNGIGYEARNDTACVYRDNLVYAAHLPIVCILGHFCDYT